MDRHTFLGWIFENYPELFFEWLEEELFPQQVLEMFEVQEVIDNV